MQDLDDALAVGVGFECRLALDHHADNCLYLLAAVE